MSVQRDIGTVLAAVGTALVAVLAAAWVGFLIVTTVHFIRKFW